MRLLKRAEVLELTALTAPMLKKWRENPAKAFPKPVSEDPLLWLDADIDAWLLSLSTWAPARQVP